MNLTTGESSTSTETVQANQVVTSIFVNNNDTDELLV